MSDREFALAILDLMPQDDGWRTFVSGLRTKVRDLDAQNLQITSITLITSIRDKFWFRHKDDQQSLSTIFSARFDAQKRSVAQKRTRGADIVASSTAPANPNKRPRLRNPNLKCTNVHCTFKAGHDTADCIAYTGAKEGQYGDWWRGPWNIHLPESQCSNLNNVPPKNHPAHARRLSPAVHQSHAADSSLACSATSHIQSDDDTTHANSALSSEDTLYAWNMQLCDSVAQATLPVLNPALPRDNTCHHDSGANRHVFHDKSAFEEYEPIAPLTVKGFGHNLSTVAIGRGNVRLEGRHQNKMCSIILQNALHIPAARTNLISGVQLDKAGVVSTLGRNSIALSVNNKVIVSGSVVNDMYRLNLTIIRPSHISLASRIEPASLASRIGSKHKGSDFYTASWGT